MCMGIFPACVYVHHLHAMLMEARGGEPAELELQALVSCWTGRAAVLLATVLISLA